MTPGLAFFYGGLVGGRRIGHHDAEFRLYGLATGPLVAFRFSMCFRATSSSGTDIAESLAISIGRS